MYHGQSLAYTGGVGIALFGMPIDPVLAASVAVLLIIVGTIVVRIAQKRKRTV